MWADERKIEAVQASLVRTIALLENVKLLLVETLEYVERVEDKVFNPYKGG